MRRLGIVVIALVVSVLAVPSLALAQDTPGTITRVFTVKAKSGAAPQLEAAIKEFAAWLGEQNDDWNMAVWQFVTGERTNQYIIRNEGHTWAEFGEREGSDIAMAAQAKIAELKIPDYVDSIATSFERTRLELSRISDNPKLFLVRVVENRLQPGAQGAYLRALAKIQEVAKDGPNDYVTIQNLNGGVTPTITRVTLYASWDALEGQGRGRFIRAMDEKYGRGETQAILESMRSLRRSQRSNLARYRPELSYEPATMTTTSQP